MKVLHILMLIFCSIHSFANDINLSDEKNISADSLDIKVNVTEKN